MEPVRCPKCRNDQTIVSELVDGSMFILCLKCSAHTKVDRVTDETPDDVASAFLSMRHARLTRDTGLW